MKPDKKKLRRGRGEGAIWQLEDGTWCGQISLGGSKRHRRRRSFRADTKQELIDMMARARSKQLDGALPEPSAITIEHYLTHWLATIRGSVADATVDSYERNVRTHVLPVIGDVRIQKLIPANVESVLNKIPGLRLRQYVRTILSNALDHAAEQNLIVRNPCDTVKRPRPQKKEIHPLDASQAGIFLKTVKRHDLEALFVLAITTGARQGEMLALQWGDVDLKRGTMSIRRTLTTAGGRTFTKEPKTKAGRRQIELDARGISALMNHRKASLKAGRAAYPWIFCDADGGFLNRFAVGREFHRLLRKAKLPAIRFHDLRHTNATLLLASGASVKLVSERLGHASIAITLDIYAHVLPQMETDAVKNFSRLLG